MKTTMLRGWKFVAVGTTLVVLNGCATTGEQAERDTVTRNVGQYAAAPAVTQKPRVGVPPFDIQQSDFSFSGNSMEAMAADQLTTLMHMTNRFEVIERTQLTQLLAEQGLEGIVRPGELAQPGQVRGVDYLLLGKITAFRVKASRTSEEAGVTNGLISRKLLKGFTGGINQDKTTLTTEVGVDLRLVDPTTGAIKSTQFSQYKQQDTAESFGIDVAGVGGSGNADVRISEDDAGKIMRLAFDDALRKMIPQIDSLLVNEWRNTGTASVNVNTGAVAGGEAASTASSTPKFCPQCGESLASGVKFCGDCGHKLQ